MDTKTTFPLSNGSTRNIAKAPTKILGRLVAVSPSESKHHAAKKLEKTILLAMQRIHERPIRGEFKVWIWKNYLAPSLHFLLMVDIIPESSILTIQKKITKFIKKWLNLPRCCTLATIFHPMVLNLPFLPQARECAKLSMIVSIGQSKDPLITECISLLNNPDFLSRNQLPQNSIQLLDAARRSACATSNTTKSTIKTQVRKSLRQNHSKHWNNTLDHLQIQSKFRDIITLEPESHTWNRLIAGLPAGQLSFLLRAGADCLPTPLNLRRWKYSVHHLSFVWFSGSHYCSHPKWVS